MDSETFTISCYIFPLSSVDLILGVSWLETLGDVKANWKNSTMEFVIEGRRICVQGDPTLTRKACTHREIRALLSEDKCWVIWAMDGEDLPSRF